MGHKIGSFVPLVGNSLQTFLVKWSKTAMVITLLYIFVWLSMHVLFIAVHRVVLGDTLPEHKGLSLQQWSRLSHLADKTPGAVCMMCQKTP